MENEIYSTEPMSSQTNNEPFVQSNPTTEWEQINPNFIIPYHEISTIILMVFCAFTCQLIPAIFGILSLTKGLDGKDIITANKYTKIGWILYVIGIVLAAIIIASYISLVFYKLVDASNITF